MIHFLLNFFRNFFINLLVFLRLRKSIDEIPKDNKANNMYLIQVNYNLKKLSGNIKIGLNQDSKIQDAKQIIVDKLNEQIKIKFNDQTNLLKSDEIAIIFAGQELNDENRIGDFDLGQYSILNVVSVNEKLKQVKSKQVDLFETAILLSTNLDNEPIDNNESTDLSKEIDDFVYLNKDGTESNVKQMTDQNLINLTKDKKSYFFVYCSSCKKINKGKLRVKCTKCKQQTLIIEQRPCDWSDILESNRIRGRCQNSKCKGIFAEFYFKCSSDDHQNDENKDQEEKALPLISMKKNTRLRKCAICDDTKDSIFQFRCGHIIDIDCFLLYCESKLNSRDLILIDQIGYTLSCPFDCTDSYISDCHYFHILDDKDYERYQDFAAEEYVLRQNGVICPNPNCGQPMLIDKIGENCTKICCITCNHLFCKLCKGDYHEDSCITDVFLDSLKTNSSINENNKSFSQLLKDKITSLSWMKKEEETQVKIQIKRCPNKSCNAPTERDQGCLHITCQMCKLDWCWLCETPWENSCMADHWFD